MSSVAIWWVRRDLRLTDNPALHAALANGRSIIPLFVLDDRLLQSDKAAPQRIAFMLAGLQAFDTELRARGSRLLVRTGRPEKIVPQIMHESGATAVYAQENASPFSFERDMVVNQFNLEILCQSNNLNANNTSIWKRSAKAGKE